MISVAGGLAIGALIIFAAQLLPVSTSGYARDKSSYLALLVFPLVLAAATPWLHHSSSAVVRWTELTAVAFVLISLPLTGGGLSWAGELEGQRTELAQRLSDAASSGSGDERLVCVPSAEQPAYNNYYCQRWLDAFSPSQSDGRLRNIWLSAGSDPAAAINRANALGLLGHDPHLVDALWVMRGLHDAGFLRTYDVRAPRHALPLSHAKIGCPDPDSRTRP